MAESGSWPSIQKHGLLSTTALLDLFEIDGPKRYKIESTWRQRSVKIAHAVHGTAIIRDQNPMPPGSLQEVLEDITPKQWYELLNGKTFFWLTHDRLSRLLNGRMYRNRSHDVIAVDTRALVERHLNRITLSRINSGFARFGQGKRDLNTFKSITQYPPMNRMDAVAELAVDYCVPDIATMIVRVEQWKGSTFQGTVWQA